MDAAAYRREIHDAFSQSSGDLDAQVQRGLEIGASYLGLPIGFLTKIEDGRQTIVEAVGNYELIQPGETCPLDEAYCRRTVELDSALAVQHAATADSVSETAYDAFDLGTYVGVRVDVDGETYGTVCFADVDDRAEPFSAAEESFVELLAALVGQALEHRAYERELEERNERLQAERDRIEAIAENSFDVLYRVAPDGTFTYVSAAAERIVGYDSDAMEGSPFAEYLTPTSRQRAIEAHEAILRGETVQQLELEFTHAAGEPVLLEINSSPITVDGEIVGTQGVGRDVTARREREAELRLKNRAIDEADVGISIADPTEPDTPLLYVNDGFERITGYDAEDVVGENCRFLQGPATDPDRVAELAATIAAGDARTVELVNYRADGSPFWNQVRLSPIEENGQVTQYLGFQEDVTERKRTEQLVRLLNRVLRHNLRNDMTAVLGFAELLADASPSEVTEYGERIEETARTLVQLSEQANALERVAYQEREPRRIEPAELIETVASEAAQVAGSITVDVDLSSDRSICAGTELEEALSELVANAIAHNDRAEPWVEIAATDDGEWIEITVEDDGPGISGMETSMIADGRETPLEHGSGLGLWLVNWIVTRYGGSFQIEAVGEGDEGSIATLQLPAITADQTVAEAARRPTVLFR